MINLVLIYDRLESSQARDQRFLPGQRAPRRPGCSGNDVQLSLFSEMLKNYEDNCLKSGNFFEAEASKLRIAQLKE